MVFEQICNSRWFTHTSMILFLNKIDLFQEKLRYSSLTAYFPDFKGSACLTSDLTQYLGDEKNYLEASRYFQRKFIRLNRSAEKEVYTHFTNATGKIIPQRCAILTRALDTNILRNVMNSVQDTIMNNNFRHLIL